MTLTIPSYKKPVEEVARAISVSFPVMFSEPVPTIMATAALTRLRQLGFINDIGLAAIHAEEDSNGQPRSSVVPGQEGRK